MKNIISIILFISFLSIKCKNENIRPPNNLAGKIKTLIQYSGITTPIINSYSGINLFMTA